MLSIVGLALAANAPSLQVRSRPRDEPFVLNLRGGAEDAAPPAAPSVAPTALTPEEITEKLNGIPVFALLNKEGGIVSMRDPDGGDAPVCRWFVDATEAKMVLKAALAANPGTCLPYDPRPNGPSTLVTLIWSAAHRRRGSARRRARSGQRLQAVRRLAGRGDARAQGDALHGRGGGAGRLVPAAGALTEQAPSSGPSISGPGSPTSSPSSQPQL